MSRVAKKPVEIPGGVDVKLDGQALSIKGSKGALEREIHGQVAINIEDNVITFVARAVRGRSVL